MLLSEIVMGIANRVSINDGTKRESLTRDGAGQETDGTFKCRRFNE